MSMKHPLGPATRTRFTSVEQSDVQPNSIDLKLEKVLIPQQSVFILSEDKKVHRTSREMRTVVFQNEQDWWCLHPGFYEIIFKNEIKLPKGEAGIVIPRSTLVRNGVFLITGLYDSGYEGLMVSGLHVTTGAFYVKKGTRLAQFMLFESETLRKYNGAYGMRSVHDNEKYEEKVAAGRPDGRKKPKTKPEITIIKDDEEFDQPKPRHENIDQEITDEMSEVKNLF